MTRLSTILSIVDINETLDLLSAVDSKWGIFVNAFYDILQITRFSALLSMVQIQIQIQLY